MAWSLSWKPDVDGRLILGKCKKASDLDRELAPWDFVILLNREFWYSPRVNDLQRAAVLDHELHHAALTYDEQGDPKRDERGRYVYRVRKHDLEEFSAIAARYGCWKGDIEEFWRALQRAEQKASGSWIGYSRLHEVLKAVGVAVDVEVIARWPERERRDVFEWAELRKADDGRQVNAALSEFIPPCLAEALGMSSTPAGGDSATQH